MGNEKPSKVLIIGSGPAGYTAAIYAARAKLEPVMVTGVQPGGQLTLTTGVENYPGFAEAVQGPWLMEQMYAQAERFGTEMIFDAITEVDLSRRPFAAIGSAGTVYQSETLIICTGANARWLGLTSEERLRGLGVSACATCDGPLFQNKAIVVVGGGNTAVEEALYLANHASKVTIVHRRDRLRAERILQDRVFAHPRIGIVWDSVVDEILESGSQRVSGVRLRNVKTGTLSKLAVDGVFVAIGHTPATELFRGKLDMDADGYIKTASDSTATSVPGVFAAGDVRDKVFRQAVTAAGTGCMAALEAERFLAFAEAGTMRAAEFLNGGPDEAGMCCSVKYE